MALFDTIPREMHENTVAQLRGDLERERARYDELVKQVVEMKRHDYGMNPQNFNADSLLPEYGLGPKTLMAVDEFAAGDAELRRYLVGFAWQEWNKRSEIEDAAERDKQVAARILAGDQ